MKYVEGKQVFDVGDLVFIKEAKCEAFTNPIYRCDTLKSGCKNCRGVAKILDVAQDSPNVLPWRYTFHSNLMAREDETCVIFVREDSFDPICSETEEEE